MGEEEERYHQLGVEEALQRPQDYPSACRELSFLLRRAYSKLPKPLQSLLFSHTITAFRLLPLQGTAGTSAANLLFQASEAALPKQRKALAVSEFKRAVVAQKRRLKGSHAVDGFMQLPEDVLVHIFSFLDLRSLAASSFVCKLWRSASSNETLWKSQYFLFFGKNEEHSKTLEPERSFLTGQNKDDGTLTANYCWREVLTRKFTGKSWSSASERAYCNNCKTMIWLSSLTCNNPHSCVNNGHGPLKINLMSSSKVTDFLLGEAQLSFSSDSDCDSDGEYFTEGWLPKLWAYSMHIDTNRMHVIN